jgi:hypothetical protein
LIEEENLLSPEMAKEDLTAPMRGEAIVGAFATEIDRPLSTVELSSLLLFLSLKGVSIRQDHLKVKLKKLG